MNKFMSKYKQNQLEATAQGATLAEEVISSIRSVHAFGNQKRLAAMYDEPNQKTLQEGLKSALFNGGGCALPLPPASHSRGRAPFFLPLSLTIFSAIQSGRVLLHYLQLVRVSYLLLSPRRSG